MDPQIASETPLCGPVPCHLTFLDIHEYDPFPDNPVLAEQRRRAANYDQFATFQASLQAETRTLLAARNELLRPLRKLVNELKPGAKSEATVLAHTILISTPVEGGFSRTEIPLPAVTNLSIKGHTAHLRWGEHTVKLRFDNDPDTTAVCVALTGETPDQLNADD